MRSEATTASVILALIVFAVTRTGFSLVHPGEADPVPHRHFVEIRGLQFQPAELAVAARDTVVWINRDIVPHTIAALDAEWSSGELIKGGSWRWIAQKEGMIPYYCEYHPTMRGRVVVR